MADSGVRRTRGLYRTKAQIPRQTAYNRCRKNLVRGKTLDARPSTNSTSETGSLGCATQDNNATEQPMTDFDAISTTSSSHGDVTNEDITAQNLHSADDGEHEAEEGAAFPLLYEGSVLTVESSLLLLNSYVCHHNLTQQASQDLLQLLRLHLPKDNVLPPSLYLFHKQSEEIESQYTDIDVAPNFHHYCPECYTLLTDHKTTLCVNEHCKTEINFDSSPSFITVSIADQLRRFLACESPCTHNNSKYIYS